MPAAPWFAIVRPWSVLRRSRGTTPGGRGPRKRPARPSVASTSTSNCRHRIAVVAGGLRRLPRDHAHAPRALQQLHVPGEAVPGEPPRPSAVSVTGHLGARAPHSPTAFGGGFRGEVRRLSVQTTSCASVSSITPWRGRGAAGGRLVVRVERTAPATRHAASHCKPCLSFRNPPWFDGSPDDTLKSRYVHCERPRGQHRPRAGGRQTAMSNGRCPAGESRGQPASPAFRERVGARRGHGHGMRPACLTRPQRRFPRTRWS